MSDTTTERIPSVRVLGGPTTVIELGGLRLVTDPTFDPPGDYEMPNGLVLTKTEPTPTSPDRLGPIDVVLLSHDQHPDNLDHAGRELLGQVPHVVTTRSGAERLGGDVRGLAPWDAVEVERPNGAALTITALPARHGPEGCEEFVGEVIGFLLTAEDLEATYVSGDNASLDLVREIVDRVETVDTAVIFAGAVRTPLFDGALLTLDSEQAAMAAQLLGARNVVVAHTDSWAHFTETWDDVIAAFRHAALDDRLQPRSGPSS